MKNNGKQWPKLQQQWQNDELQYHINQIPNTKSVRLANGNVDEDFGDFS